MTIQLSRDIRYCVVNDRAAFLDLRTDRYFCLVPPLDAKFRQFVNGNLRGHREDASINELINIGVLEDEAGTGLARLAECPRPVSDIQDRGRGHTTLFNLALATACYVGARSDVLSQPIARIAGSIEKARARRAGPDSATDFERVMVHTSNFTNLRYIAKAQDKCLIWSLAMIRYLAFHDILARLVIGVKMEPFGAHAWVQSDTCVLSCPLDEALQYTPILVA